MLQSEWDARGGNDSHMADLSVTWKKVNDSTILLWRDI